MIREDGDGLAFFRGFWNALPLALISWLLIAIMIAGCPASAQQIIVTKIERHDIREEAIERVARELCEADGCDPDGNIQCGAPIGPTVQCTLLAMPYPTDRRWYAYRDTAVAMLKEAFR